LVLGTLGPLDLGTLGPWLLVVVVSCDIGEKDWRWTFDLYIDLKKFSSSNLLPPPSYSSQLLLPPPKPSPNSSYFLLKGLR